MVIQKHQNTKYQQASYFKIISIANNKYFNVFITQVKDLLFARQRSHQIPCANSIYIVLATSILRTCKFSQITLQNVQNLVKYNFQENFNS